MSDDPSRNGPWLWLILLPYRLLFLSAAGSLAYAMVASATIKHVEKGRTWAQT